MMTIRAVFFEKHTTRLVHCVFTTRTMAHTENSEEEKNCHLSGFSAIAAFRCSWILALGVGLRTRRLAFLISRFGAKKKWEEREWVTNLIVSHFGWPTDGRLVVCLVQEVHVVYRFTSVMVMAMGVWLLGSDWWFAALDFSKVRGAHGLCCSR